MTDEQRIERIREMTNLVKVDDDREAYRLTRDALVQQILSYRKISGVLRNLTSRGDPNNYEEDLNNFATEEQKVEVKRLDRFIAALDEQAEKLRERHEATKHDGK
jgi:hypothetical protein